jgi:26S proteasome regulatory subunit N11
LQKPSIQALIHGLNRHYYSIVIDHRKNELEEQMLMNLHSATDFWTAIAKVSRSSKVDGTSRGQNVEATKDYNERVQQEGKTVEQILVDNGVRLIPSDI